MTARPRLVVLDGYTMGQDISWQALADQGPLTVFDRTAPGQVLERAAGADVLLTNKTVLDAATIHALPDLKCILVLATGYNVVDIAAAAKRGIPVCNVPGYSPPSVAQHVLSVVLEMFSHTSHHARAVSEGRWSAQPDFCFWDAPVVELAGKTFGVVGFGAIGQRVAELAHAFGMHVLAFAPRPKPAPAYQPFAFAGLDELFAASDVISLHCPLTADNENLVDARLLGLMKPTARLVNTARGQLVDEAALAAALTAGRLGGAALDVVRVEPIQPGNPLLSAPNCLLTPHVAWASQEARTRLMAGVAANLAGFLAGQPQNVVNKIS
ncbi:MAG: glycerate dehydrogenase [Deltaproteobacteria bacterium HGW-Deltaproteobacteria-8]|jgi:glycerate dehydrogenase|nr:MAG: glycerate dehydrogenase [Deltaproteobacteria bacterium HGW-Deltaproteobacteria-8]